jgi:hypothetical protein
MSTVEAIPLHLNCPPPSTRNNQAPHLTSERTSTEKKYFVRKYLRLKRFLKCNCLSPFLQEEKYFIFARTWRLQSSLWFLIACFTSTNKSVYKRIAFSGHCAVGPAASAALGNSLAGARPSEAAAEWRRPSLPSARAQAGGSNFASLLESGDWPACPFRAAGTPFAPARSLRAFQQPAPRNL